ncbi:hypothetical protein IWQ60_007392 [Tieghemiomyces parasiticus]|uniref:Metallo-beta-lactamase domain-containing protein n=1 Tax=Tieghemiomyces parasiticus TaxID=78921 RepID=A0A9W7ZXN7_9FUNG|nr:hypothetical protein IWQ60_007392 [Tieghemiomyces parasiticus]
MDPLAALPLVEKMSSRVFRVLGMNPGKFTLQGTNTYIIGHGPRRILLDTGEGKPGYIPLLDAALSHLGVSRISDIIMTHWHHDHTGGLPPLLERLRVQHPQSPLPKVWKRFNSDRDPALLKKLAAKGLHYRSESSSIPATSTALTSGDTSGPPRAHEPLAKDLEPTSTLASPSPSTVTSTDSVVWDIADNQIFRGQDTTLHALYTPGHTTDHMAFYLEEERALFSGDCVLGHGTAVFEDLHQYIQSLKRLRQYDALCIYPGHGAVVTDPSATLDAYIRHRMDREEEIIHLLSSQPTIALGNALRGPAHDGEEALNGNTDGYGGDGFHQLLLGQLHPISDRPTGPGGAPLWTSRELVQVIYAKYPKSLYDAAEASVLLHLAKLQYEDRVDTVLVEDKTYWTLPETRRR